MIELALGILAGLFVSLLTAAIRYRHCLIAGTKSILFYANKDIRVSIAGILKIKQDNKYILIRSHRRPEQFGPIGGVFKYHSLAIPDLERFNFRQDPAVDESMKLDMRGIIKGKYLLAFMRWFKSHKNREIEPLTRELIEELNEISLEKEAESIQALQYNLVQTAHEGPYAVSGHNYMQFRYFEIYQFDIDDSRTKRIFDAIIASEEQNTDIIAVTSEEILKRRADSGELIGTHCGYLIGEKASGPEPAPFI